MSGDKLERRRFLLTWMTSSVLLAALALPLPGKAKGGDDEPDEPDDGGEPDDGAGVGDSDDDSELDPGNEDDDEESTSGRGRDQDGGGDIGIGYADGSWERIRGGVYERTDGYGQITERRRSTRKDRQRLQSLAKAVRARDVAGQPTKASIAHASRSGGSMEIQYADGWREEILNGFYTLTDPSGNTVVRRASRAKDVRRMRQAMANQ